MRYYQKNGWVLPLVLFVFVSLWYMATWQHIFMGYEQETAQSAVLMFSGTYQVFRAGIGAVVMYLPFVALGKLFYPQNILAFLTIVPVFYSAAVAVILYFICLRLSSRKSVSLTVACLTALASLMWPYSRIGMEYQAMLWLAVLLLSLLAWRKSLSLPIFAGAALAMLAFSKSYGVIFGLPAALFVCVEFWQKGRLKRLVSFNFLASLFGPTVLVLAAGAALNYVILGKASGVYNLAQEFQVWSWWQGFFGVFFSAGKSIIFYSPLLIVTLWYWKKFWQTDRACAIFVAASFLLLLLLTAPFSFWSDETLSVRKLVPVVPLLHLPLVYAFEGPVWSKLKKFGFAFIICVSLYFQFINTLYPYWLQLVMLRPYNLDALTAIRYNPSLSALAISNRLFLSYLNRIETGKSKNFNYQERSWMRCCTGQPSGDPFLARINISLANFDRPEIYLVRGENKKRKKIALGLEAAGLLLAGGFLTASIINSRKLENR